MNIRKFKWIFAFAGAIAVVLLLRGFAFTSCLIPSTGMENSLFQGERILVNKWSYGLRLPLMSLLYSKTVSTHRRCFTKYFTGNRYFRIILVPLCPRQQVTA